MILRRARRLGATSGGCICAGSCAVDPPTISDIIAIAAPSYVSRANGDADIEHILVTAYTGLSAAGQESKKT